MMMMVYDGRGRLQARGELNLLPVGRMVVLADENQGEQLCPTNRLFTFADLCRRHQKTSLVDDSKKHVAVVGDKENVGDLCRRHLAET